MAAFAIVAVFGYPTRIGLTVAAGLAQVGEFSFILGTMGLSLGLLPPEGFQLIVAGALLSIAINPFLFRAIEPAEARLRDVGILRRLAERGSAGTGHARRRRRRTRCASTPSSAGMAGSASSSVPRWNGAASATWS